MKEKLTDLILSALNWLIGLFGLALVPIEDIETVRLTPKGIKTAEELLAIK